MITPENAILTAVLGIILFVLVILLYKIVVYGSIFLFGMTIVVLRIISEHVPGPSHDEYRRSQRKRRIEGDNIERLLESRRERIVDVATNIGDTSPASVEVIIRMGTEIIEDALKTEKLYMPRDHIRQFIVDVLVEENFVRRDDYFIGEREPIC